MFYDKTRLPRKPLERFWLEQTKAPNKTFEEYRDKVATYLKSSEFKQQWDALKSQVRAQTMAIAGGVQTRNWQPWDMPLLVYTAGTTLCVRAWAPVSLSWLVAAVITVRVRSVSYTMPCCRAFACTMQICFTPVQCRSLHACAGVTESTFGISTCRTDCISTSKRCRLAMIVA